MIVIFHGENISLSKTKLQEVLFNKETVWIEGNNIKVDTVSNLFGEEDLFGRTKTIVISNYFNISASVLSSINKLIINKSRKGDIYIWQNKRLNTNQIKTFPNASIQYFKKTNSIYSCLHSIKTGNANQFVNLYQRVLEDNLFDLFLYLVKKELRKKTGDLRYKKTYLNLIELDLLNKSGKLTIKKETALKRTLLPLTK